MTDQSPLIPYIPDGSATANDLAFQAEALAERLRDLAAQASEGVTFTPVADAGMAAAEAAGHDGGFFLTGLSVFILACFVGYYVVWKVTAALHSPLMGITNAVSSVIIVGALIAAGPFNAGFAGFLGFIGIVLASINIFGGFIVTKRMLDMFQKKKG